ncbi:MAG: hypothetical protein IJR55_04235 [Clostridia bacterium]|nr:hypothetical protein [Clostridia bacterium]
MDVKKFTVDLCSLMSIDGFEFAEEDKMIKLVLPYFDSVKSDSVGNYVFVLKSKKKHAPKLFIDTHYDEVGLMVKGITDDGMLRICGIGGVDARILPSSEVVVYGKKKIKGIVALKPTALIPAESRDRLVPVTELLVDIGYPKEKTEKLAPIGTPIGYKPDYVTLGKKYLSGKSLDDKVCAVAVIKAISLLDREKLGCDIYFSMSAKEETGGSAVPCAVFDIQPDFSISLDVTFGMAPGGNKLSDMKMGGGAVVTRSLLTDRETVAMIENVAKEKELPIQSDVCPMSTGTHNDDIVLVGRGVPGALISIPAWFMHTQSETVCIDDIENTAKLLCAVIEKKFGGEEK